jgi:ComF family protein
LARRCLGPVLGGVQQWADAAVKTLYPPQCAYCGDEVAECEGDLLLCEDCCVKLAPDKWNGCPRCGGEVASTHTSPDCERCRGTRFHFDTVISLGSYHTSLRAAIIRMKRGGAGEALSAAIARLMLRERGERFREAKPQVVVPIPMFWLRSLYRGVSNPDILAETWARSLHVPADLHLLCRTRNTKLQRELGPRERAKNVRGAFRLREPLDLAGLRILLVDDVLTTGATCSEAAKTLKAAGASWVGTCVLARATGDADRS